MLSKLREIVGEKHVMTGAQAERYGADATGKYEAAPLAVVRPADAKEVSKVLALANATKTPVVPISGNTGLVGGSYAPDGIMISLERLNAIREIRPDSRIAIVEAGVILSKLHEAAGEHDMVFPLTFGARGSAMIGGNLSTNAGGSNVVRYGSTRALCLGIEVVLPDGRIMDLMSELHKDNSGYALKDLYIGSEGTLGIITAAVVKLFPKPKAYATAMLAAKSVPDTLTILNSLQESSGGIIEAFEYMPRTYMQKLAEIRPDLPPPLGTDHDTTIFLELGATAPRDSTPRDDGSLPLVDLLENNLADLIEQGLILDATLARSETQRTQMWAMREAAAELTFSRKPLVDTDLSVPLDKVNDFLETAHERLAILDAGADTFTVSHLGDGNLHFNIWPTSDDPQLMDQIREMVEDVTVELRGSFSAEHGIGLSKIPSMKRRKDTVAIDVMHAIKAALDPNNIMNPGKVLPKK
ncbi:MAG: FAD-binding oxidoreductase [Marinosulfonomonas sp.]